MCHGYATLLGAPDGAAVMFLVVETVGDADVLSSLAIVVSTEVLLLAVTTTGSVRASCAPLCVANKARTRTINIVID